MKTRPQKNPAMSQELYDGLMKLWEKATDEEATLMGTVIQKMPDVDMNPILVRHRCGECDEHTLFNLSEMLAALSSDGALSDAVALTIHFELTRAVCRSNVAKGRPIHIRYEEVIRQGGGGALPS